MEAGVRVYTIGHSTRSIYQFLDMLKTNAVDRVIDVRTVPCSRHNPQYNREELSAALEMANLHYTYMPGLGGFRRPLKGATANLGWRNLSFRGYADYMQTPEFELYLQELMALASEEQVAIMCAEAVPWRCHRSLIADTLLVRGTDVREIANLNRTSPLTIRPWAQVNGMRLTYPAFPPDLP